MKSAIRAILDMRENSKKTVITRPPLLSEEESRKLAKRVLRNGKPICAELEKAGFSHNQSRKGMRTVMRSRILRRAFLIEKDAIMKGKPKEELGLNLEQAEGLIVDRLRKNIKAGKDNAVMSAKLLGSHKKLNLWQPENQTGIIVINTPTDGADFAAPDKMLPQSDD
jgi:hypothetical protein